MQSKKKFKNAIIICPENKLWIEILKKLYKKKIFPKILFFTSSNFFNKKYFNIKPMDALSGNLNYSNSLPLDKSLIRYFNKHEPILMQMISRHLENKFIYTYKERRQFIHDNIKYYNTLIKKNNISIFINASEHHRIYDYIIFLLCDYYKICSINPYYSLIPHLDFFRGIHLNKNINLQIDEDWNSIKNYITSFKKKVNKALSQKVNFESSFSAKGGKNVYPYNFYNSTIFCAKKLISFYFYKFFNKKTNIIKLEKKLLSKSNFFLKELLTFLQLKKSFNWYKKNSLKSIRREKYYYMPLSSQPEATTVPGSKFYYEFSYICQVLKSSFPKNCKLYIKEHPKTFNDYPLHNASRSVDEYVYAKKVFKRIEYIDHEIDNQKLIEKSEGVICPCEGTSILEATLKGKKVLVFGTTEFTKFSNVFNGFKTKEIRDFFVNKKIINNQKIFNNDLKKLFLHSNNLNDYFKNMSLLRSNKKILKKKISLISEKFVKKVLLLTK